MNENNIQKIFISVALQHIERLKICATELECIDASYLEELEHTLLKEQNHE